jgi:hypothetical protein
VSQPVKGISMRKNSRFIVLSIFVLISFLIPQESLCAEATKVIIGMDAPTLSDLRLSVALKKDFFKPEGLNILQVLFRSGPTASRPSFQDRFNSVPGSEPEPEQPWRVRRLKGS